MLFNIYYILFTIFREEAPSALAGFHVHRSSILIKLQFGDVRFVEGGKLVTPGNCQSKVKTNNKLDPHMSMGWNWTWAILVGGEHSQHCTITAYWCINFNKKQSWSIKKYSGFYYHYLNQTHYRMMLELHLTSIHVHVHVGQRWNLWFSDGIGFREQGWCSLIPAQCHMWVVFVVGSCFVPRFFLLVLRFSSLHKN